MSIVETIGIVLGSGGLFSFITWIASRRTRKAQLKNIEAQTADFLANAYAKLINDLTTELDGLRAINKEMAASKDELIQEIHVLQKQVTNLKRDLSRMTKKLDEYENGKDKV